MHIYDTALCPVTGVGGNRSSPRWRRRRVLESPQLPSSGRPDASASDQGVVRARATLRRHFRVPNGSRVPLERIGRAGRSEHVRRHDAGAKPTRVSPRTGCLPVGWTCNNLLLPLVPPHDDNHLQQERRLLLNAVCLPSAGCREQSIRDAPLLHGQETVQQVPGQREGVLG